MGLANLQILVRLIAQKEGINVRIDTRTQTAYFDGQGITIPSKWVELDTPEAENLIIGIIAHEGAGHAKHTCMTSWRACTKKIETTLLNILEDIRIENRVIEERPFFGPVLADTVRHLNETEQFFSFNPHSKGIELFINTLLVAGRCWCIKWQYPVLRHDARLFYKVALREFGDVWKQVFRIAIKAKTAESTADALKLVREILSLIKSDGENQNETGKGQGSTDGSGQTDDPSAQGGGISKSLQDLKQDVNNDIDAGVVTELADMLNHVVGEMAASAFSEDSRIGQSLMEDIDKSSETLVSPNDSVQKLRRQISLLSNDICEKFEADKRMDRTVSKTGRKLSSKHLHRVSLDNPNIFREKRVERDDVDTSVLFLLDRSYSMKSKLSSGETRMDAVNALMLGFGDMLEELEVDFQFTAYSGTLTDLKSFDDGWYVASASCLEADGGTVTGQAVTQKLPDLIARPTSRKILICITDGETFDLDVLTSAFEETTKYGVEIVNIFIGSEIASIKHLADRFGFPCHTCNSSYELNRYVLSVFETL